MENLEFKKYQLLISDPPWSYKDKRTGGSMKSSSAQKYPVMDTEEIKRLPVRHITNENSILLLWVTCPFLPDAFEVIANWGFEYKTVAFCWIKLNKYWHKYLKYVEVFTPNSLDRLLKKGMGHYTMSNVELCLIARRGKGLPRMVKNIRQVLFSPIGEHSRKPNKEFRKRVIELYGYVSTIELFATKDDDTPDCGFDLIGHEINKGKDIRDILYTMLTGRYSEQYQLFDSSKLKETHNESNK